MLTAEQLAIRRTRCAGTDIGAIMGLNPWKGPISVWRSKVLGEDDPVEGARVEWGNRLEPEIRRWYSDTLGVDVTEPGTLFHPTDELAVATPDGVAYEPGARAPRNGLEIKTHTINMRHLYGAPGTDEVPLWELTQCAWNMYVAALPFWHLVPFLDGLPALYKIPRDMELEGLMVEARDRFWRDHVVTRRPPPPDGTRSYSADLLRRFPADRRAGMVEAGDAQLAKVRELRNVRDQLWALERRQAVLEQTIKESIGDREGIMWMEGRRSQAITWRLSADSTRVDWEAVARERGERADLLESGMRALIDNAERGGMITRGAAKAMREAIGFDEEPDSTAAAIERNTVTVPGSRRFVAPRTWSRERPTDVDLDAQHKEQAR